MPRVLIVAYGNPLRSDDGVAWRAGDALASKFPESEIEIVRLHQLTPELSETVSYFERVIFIDAASRQGTRNPGDIHIEQILAEGKKAGNEPRFSHVLTAHSIVSLATTLYRARLQAFLVTITGENFSHGESLSDPVSSALPNVIATVERLIHSPDS